MRNPIRTLCVALLALALPTALAAGTLVGAFDVGPGGSPVPSGPWYNTAGNTWISKIWTPLVSQNEDASALAPQLATAWSANDDLTEWTFDLRQGVTWHDGAPFTAADVKFTWEWVYAPGTNAAPEIPPSPLVGQAAYTAGEADAIAGLEIVDDHTVRFVTAEPSPRFPDTLIKAYILPAHALTGVTSADIRTTDWWFTVAIGTGPFMHDEFVPDEFWALKANPDFWRGAPKLDRLINRYFADETAAILALESGDIQFTYASGDVAVGLGEDPAFDLFSGPSGVTNYLIFNFREPVFQDVRVRQAFLHAIDRETIAEVVLGGTARVVPCLTPFEAFWPETYDPYPYDPAKARELLAEAGWDGSTRFDVVTYYDSQFHADAMAAMQQFLSEAGIDVTFILDAAGYNSYFYTGEGWDVSYRGLGVNMQAYPYRFYEEEGWPEVIGEERTLIGQRVPELEELFARARLEADPDAYRQIMQEVCGVQNEMALEGYLWTAIRFGVASSSLVDFYWYPAPAGGPYEDHAELWSLGD
jgi:peptide/nickel transport system substrate-binding protein